jgi:hypothetical protein
VIAVSRADNPVGAALARCSLYEVSPATRAALQQAWSSLSKATDADDHGRAATLLGLVVSSPEFAVA